MWMFAEFIKEQKGLNLSQIDSDNILLFLDSRKRNREQDPDQKWITTWNDYLWRIKIFYRWYYNTKILKNNIFDLITSRRRIWINNI
jgi:site-specific recombinase XerD